MFAQRPVIKILPLIAAFGLAGAGASSTAAEQTSPLPRPPGVRVETLPRKLGDKPQETVVAVNPRDPRNAVVSYHQAVGEGSDHHPNVRVDAHVAWTADGGKTWTVAKNTTHKDYRVSIDTAIAFDLRGHAYLVFIGMNEMSQTTRNGEYLLRSTDGGKTWEPPVTLIENPGGSKPIFEHIPYIVADNDTASPHAGNVYVVWTRNFFDERGDQINIVRSTDGGRTWSKPKVIAHEGSVISAVVGSDGTLYLMYVYFTRDSEVAVAVSRDGGETFADPVTITRPSPNPNKYTGPGAAYAFPRSFGWPSMAIDPRGKGRLFVAWGDYRNGDRDVMSVTSADQGRTWSKPVRVNNDPVGNGRDQLTQFVAVDPTDGAAYVLFYDRRNDAKNMLPTVTLARSVDGGRTFTNYAWSNKVLDPKQAVFGDYIGMAARGGLVYGAWVENIDSEPGPRKSPQKVLSGSMTLEPDDWPFGPAAIRVGIADFRAAAGSKRQGGP